MPKRKRNTTSKPSGNRPARRARHLVRKGETRLRIRNSGLEVWLYDDANREVIRRSSVPFFAREAGGEGFEELLTRGLLVGYSLLQDDDVFAALWAIDGDVGVFFLTRLSDQRWIVTGFADGLGTRVVRTGKREAARIRPIDDSLSAIHDAHREAIDSEDTYPAPGNLAEAVVNYERFMKTAFD